MKKCNACNTEFADTLDFCPECGSKDFCTVGGVKDEEVQPAEEEIREETVQTDSEESAVSEEEQTDTALDAEKAAEDEPVPVIGLIIAGIIGLIILGIGLYFKLKA